jgi:hypothetical protein
MIGSSDPVSDRTLAHPDAGRLCVRQARPGARQPSRYAYQIVRNNTMHSPALSQREPQPLDGIRSGNHRPQQIATYMRRPSEERVIGPFGRSLGR